MNDDIAQRMVMKLCLTLPFARLPVTNRPMEDLYNALDQALHALRLPLYWRRLGRAMPKPAAYETAVRTGLAILAAFANAVGTKQAVLSSYGGLMTSISFQPRPYGVNWTVDHALAQGDIHTEFTNRHGIYVEVSDMLHLASKVAHATCRCQAGQMVDAVTKFTFDPHDGPASVLVREVSGREHHVNLLPYA